MKHVILIFAFLLVPALAQAQVTYLATYEGTGTDADPFRAHSNIVGTECKSLRPNETLATGIAICVGPSLPVRAGVREIDLSAAVTVAHKTFLAAFLGRPITETTVGEVLSAIIDKNGISLKRGADRRQRILIKGQEIWSRPAPLTSYLPDVWRVVKGLVMAPVAWAATSLTADFNCADDATSTFSCNGYTWTLRSGSAMQLLSNAFQSLNTVAPQANINATVLDSTDMLARVVVSTINRGTATNVSAGAVVRHTDTATSTYNYCVVRDAASDEIELGHVTTGSLTADANIAATVANGDTIEVQALGDQLSCKHNGAVVAGPLTENNGLGNVNAGMRTSGSGTATTTTVILDGCYASVASAPFGPLRRRGL